MTPIPGARQYTIDLLDDPPVIYSATGYPRRPNARKAVALWCDDGVRRCRTVRRWAQLTERRNALDPLFSIPDPDRKSQLLDQLALDGF